MAKSPPCDPQYFSTLLVFALALVSLWWLWNDYMQGPWTRDGKVRAELVSITPQVSGKIVRIGVKDNQLVKVGTCSSLWIPSPIASHGQRQRGPGQGQVGSRQGGARGEPSPESLPHRHLRRAVDESRLNAQAMKAAYGVAQANLEQARWSLPGPGPCCERRLHHQPAGQGRQLRHRRGAPGGP